METTPTAAEQERIDKIRAQVVGMYTRKPWPSSRETDEEMGWRLKMLGIEAGDYQGKKVIELGCGTGEYSLWYASHGAADVTGIDLSPDMLALARQKVEQGGLDHVEALHEMDATRLTFADGSFETVAVMYTITVVPHPDAVMAEVERVTAPGGEAIFVSHFASESGWRKAIEEVLTPFTKKLGWRPDFPIERILGRSGFELIEKKRLGLFGIFTVARLRRKAD